MPYPKFLRRLFDNDGGGTKLLGSILPFGNADPLAAGTASAGTSDVPARADHVHPMQTTIVGNAATASTADRLTTAHSVTIDLASTTAASFDGSADITTGVSGVLPIARGGTGNATGKAPSATTADSATSANTAATLTTARTIDGMSFNGSANITHYATCSTAADVADKTVTLAGFTLAVGSIVHVKFTATNTVVNPTLNINGTGAKSIRVNNVAISAEALFGNVITSFIYDGTYYQIIGGNIVMNSGTQNVGGAKVLTYDATLRNNDPYFYLSHSGLTAGTNPTGDEYCGIRTCSKDNAILFGGMYTRVNASGQGYTYIEAKNNKAASADQVTASIGIGVAGDGTVASYAPTPPAADNSTKIATTAWVRTNAPGIVFPAGTMMLFAQAAAPTGWTKQTTATYNNAAIRLVTGTTGGGTGGTVAFSTAFAANKAITLSGNVGATTLTVAQLAKHDHKLQANAGGSYDNSRTYMGTYENNSAVNSPTPTLFKSAITGSSSSHTHTLSGTAKVSLDVKYLDMIVCKKN